MKNKKSVVIGISGGIAAYKTCEVVSGLSKLGYTTKVIMTKNAVEFITPLTLETLSKNRVVVDMFAEKETYDVEHISLAKEADVFLVAPATANVIAKLANGIADDMLTATFLASKAIKVICPAMNTNMYEDETTQKNLKNLKDRGCIIVEPDVGLLACGDIGKGRMSSPAEIIREVDKLLTPNPDFRGKRVLITAGATREPVDGVRFISNYSSGKMGVALAEAALARGAEVTLVAANLSVQPPQNIRLLNVATTSDMYDTVMAELESADIIIKAAAPSDYRVKNYSKTKIKAASLTLELEKNVDIAAEVGKQKGNKKLVVFAAETDELIANAKQKLANKNADMIVANDVTKEGAGFGTDTNIVTIIKSGGEKISLPIMTKRELSDIILDNILEK
jgi:phosphopantothenoylcysteine decarboxylase/phosphopantothenate--cysteine ligase